MRQKITAMILAGGYSSRMQQFKPLLPLNGSTVIGKVVENFRKAGLDDIMIVVGHNAAALQLGIGGLGVRVVFNSKYAEGMYSSVVAGVRALQSGADACVLIPADMPLVRSSTVTRLCNAFLTVGACVVYPVFQKRRGHPTVISSSLFSAILSGDGAGGLRALLAEHDREAHEVRVLDEGILIDLDTDADYEKARKLFGQREIPTSSECEAILDEMKVLPDIVCHCRRVSEVAESLSLKLDHAGVPLNVPLVKAAALLHDLAKGAPDHASQGQRILEDMGFPGVGRVVGLHMECDFHENAAPNEAAIVYLSDKMVQGNRVVSLAQRFQRKFEIAAADGTLPFVTQRWETAQRIAVAVERILGADIERIISPQTDTPVTMVGDARTH